jgi:hypothetical protein
LRPNLCPHKTAGWVPGVRRSVHSDANSLCSAPSQVLWCRGAVSHETFRPSHSSLGGGAPRARGSHWECGYCHGSAVACFSLNGQRIVEMPHRIISSRSPHGDVPSPHSQPRAVSRETQVDPEPADFLASQRFRPVTFGRRGRRVRGIGGVRDPDIHDTKPITNIVLSDRPGRRTAESHRRDVRRAVRPPNDVLLSPAGRLIVLAEDMGRTRRRSGRPAEQPASRSTLRTDGRCRNDTGTSKTGTRRSIDHPRVAPGDHDLAWRQVSERFT